MKYTVWFKKNESTEADGPVRVMREAQVPESAADALTLRRSVFSLRRQMSEVFCEEADGILRPALQQPQQSPPQQRAHSGLRQQLLVGHDRDTGATLLRHRVKSSSRPSAARLRVKISFQSQLLWTRDDAADQLTSVCAQLQPDDVTS